MQRGEGRAGWSASNAQADTTAADDGGARQVRGVVWCGVEQGEQATRCVRRCRGAAVVCARD